MTLRVGLTQWHATRDLKRNLEIACQLVAACAADGASLVVLPENGLMLGSNAEMRAAALRLDGPELAELGHAAATAGVPVVLGGVKRLDEDGVVHNSAVVIAQDGSVAGTYDKIHLFDAKVGGLSFEASSVERPGATPTLLTLDGAVVGLTICYDLRFPELFRTLALAGAQVLLIPSAFTRVTGAAHWETLLRARAIENACFVVAPATIGDDPDDAFPTYGHAMIVDPWGEVIVDLGDAEQAHTVIELDMNSVTRTRERLPVLAGVRPDAYANALSTITLGR